jgi:type IV secretion system protein VirD4
MHSGKGEYTGMLGYDAAARVLNSGQAVFGPEAPHDAAVILTVIIAAIVAFVLSIGWERLAPVFFGPLPDPARDARPPGWPRIIFLYAGVLLLWWFIICLGVWIFLSLSGATLLTAMLCTVAGILGIEAVKWVRHKQQGSRRTALLTALGVLGFVALALLVNPSGSDRTIGVFAVATLLAVAGSAFWVYYEFFHKPRVLDEPSRTQSRSGQAWPPLGSPEVTTHGDAQLADPAFHGRAMRDILGGGKGIWFGQIIGSNNEAAYIGDRHLLTVAPNRTGKGSCTIIPNILMDVSHSIICIDPKGQNAAVTARTRRSGGRPVYCLNPFGEHTGAPWNLPMHGFNPLAAMSIDDPNVEADVASLAEALLVTESQTQPYFENSARDLIAVLIHHALATKGKAATLLDMRAWLSQPLEASYGDPSLLSTIVDMSNSKHTFIREMSARFLSNSKSVAEVVQSATNQTNFLSHRAIAACLSGNDFQMVDFKNRIATLYVILPERYLDAYSRFLRLVVVSALNGLRSRPGGTKTLIMMDEFARLGQLKAVEQAVGSSAGFNVQLWPFVQDLNQLQHLYPKRWDSFIANAGVVQWFTPNDKTTADYLCGRIGKTTVLSTAINRSSTLGEGTGRGGPSMSGSKSSSSNETETAVDFLSPQDLYNMPRDVQLLTMAELKYPVCCKREPYYEIRDADDAMKKAADPDPYHA